MVGIGGGVIIVPMLMFVFGFTQIRATGTSIAMLLPPIGIFAAISYYRAGNVDFRFAALMAIGFALGAWVGTLVVNRGYVNPTALRILFAILLVYCAARILFRPGGRAATAIQTSIVAGTTIAYAAALLVAAHLQRTHPLGHLLHARQREPFENDYDIGDAKKMRY